MIRIPRLQLALPLSVLAFLPFALVAQGRSDDSQTPASRHAAVDVEECASCHEAAVTVVNKTPHGTLEESCATCHGDPTEHVKSNLEKNEPGPIVSFKSLKPEEASKTCLTCHEKGHQANWAGSIHDRRKVACTSCHSVHNFKSPHAQLKTARDSETCFTCHQQIRAKTQRTSHHRVANWITEQCLTCHTEKRGPFLWEHAPVRENCALCHDPHGSNHDKMLVAKQPFLCQRCHLNTRHPGTLYDGRNTVGGALLSNRAVEHACKNCHQNVHGGNAPSGPYFGR